MKLDVNALRYLSDDDFRVLTAVELGMRNHEIVPADLINPIAGLKHGGTYKVLRNLLKHKLVHHDSSKYDGFRLTYLGYDFLAIKALLNRGVFVAVGRQLGVGKESDIFEVAAEDGTIMAMKLHRLGRISFRAVKSKRDYLLHRSSYNWLYLSRLAAKKEFAFMKALEEHGFPVPKAVDCNRHCVVMSLVPGYPLVQVKQLQNPETIFETIVGIVVRLAEHGLIHCDFNEFNIMIDDDEKVTMIDFPQMVSVSHRNAQMYFDRDVECIFKFFRKRFNISYECEGSDSDSEESVRPCFSSIVKSTSSLDKELAASGFTRTDQDEMEKFVINPSEPVDCGSSEEEETSDVRCLSLGNVDAAASSLDSMHIGSEFSGDFIKREVSICGSGEDDLEKSHTDGNSTHRGDGHDDVDKASVGGTTDAHNEESLRQDEEGDEDDPVLVRRLNKQRRQAVAAAHGRRKPLSSRNSYKDKGGKAASHNTYPNVIGISYVNTEF
ncbi:serine/threonine-protein kinase rio2 [Amborella trichopoda]|uniref:Serine/threonine-protein kinase RIO2 n=1 Tax=Amborella trichopoda TaxID=13333 RepID=U5DHY1_AMBTC|nr:serine/threonine-protein kinase rio2 [Amborella trichopoda]ERN20158.1 hypothetical protein AMTR_s00066p00092960 [Amborella trichopoda]|eukprot:XP_006858691.1 serine/threonine-protein kinase rio2 [Amborella trichopoda]